MRVRFWFPSLTRLPCQEHASGQGRPLGGHAGEVQGLFDRSELQVRRGAEGHQELPDHQRTRVSGTRIIKDAIGRSYQTNITSTWPLTSVLTCSVYSSSPFQILINRCLFCSAPEWGSSQSWPLTSSRWPLTDRPVSPPPLSLSTLIQDSMDELTVYRQDMQTKLAPYTQEAAQRLGDDLEWLGKKLRIHMEDGREQMEKYSAELQTMMEQNADDVRVRVSAYTRKMKKRLNKDAQEIKTWVVYSGLLYTIIYTVYTPWVYYSIIKHIREPLYR